MTKEYSAEEVLTHVKYDKKRRGQILCMGNKFAEVG